MRTPHIIAALLLAASVGLQAPAAADTTIGGGTYVLYDGCRNYPYTYSGSFAGAAEWDIDLDLYAPSGAVSDSDFDYGYGSSFSRTDWFYVCDYEGVGAYEIDAGTSWYDDFYSLIGFEVRTGWIRFQRQWTRTRLAVSDTTPRYYSVVRYRIQSTQETPSGYRPNASEYVAVERRCGQLAPWRRLGRALTDAYGNAVVARRWDTRRTCAVRAATLPTVNSATSWSSLVRINPHG